MRLAVIGDPVAHSRSPVLHREFLAEANLIGTYEALRVPAGEGGVAIERLRDAGYRGVNVTTPLKEEAFARCERCDALAVASGSVNTVVFEQGLIAGYNTDGAGVLAGMTSALGDDLRGRIVLVLGTGPTGRAAIRALLDAGVDVVIWNRTSERARDVARTLGARMWIDGQPIDAVFSALPPNPHFGETLRSALTTALVVIDANYAERATLAEQLERPVVSGLGMLEASARASFELFRRGGGD
jgi:shikimate dehydrogenase